MPFELEIDEFERLTDIIYQKAGIRFEQKKIYFIAKRLEKRMISLGSETVMDYIRHLKFADRDGREMQELLNTLTINETYFFRDFNQLQAFAEDSLDDIVTRKGAIGDRRLRIWSSGCSSGEEPYTLGIILQEMIEDIRRWDVEIIATDIDEVILEKAQKGIYMSRSVKDVPGEYLDQYFSRSSGFYHINDQIKNMVRFDHLNLNERAALRKYRTFDFIFCRNVLIYFDDVSRKRVVDHYYMALNPGGYIFLGSAESPTRINPAFNLKKTDNHMVYYK
jgi:chemotaxis protein methyltransferase CheR